MDYLILDFSKLVLRVFFDFAPNIVYKGSRFSQTSLKENFKLFLTWGYNSIIFDPIFMLLPVKKDSIFEKKSYKKYVHIIFYSNYFEMVFILLTKVIILYI